ncbi:MAG: RNA-directed DNA polymerase [Firmicutes bacterium]|nr:RNA-directed DNA polymerase [Bacillota bacterium]
MKAYYQIYHKIEDLNHILFIYKTQISPHTKNKYKIERFEEYFMCNITNVQALLKHQNIVFQPYFIFLIQEPKYRIIMSQTIRDKLINHLVAQYLLLDIYESSFIDANVATRIDKGTHYGIELTKRYIHELKKSGETIYYLKCDISKYFYSIDHEILKSILEKKIKDEKALRLIHKIVDSTNESYIPLRIQKMKELEIERIRNLNIPENELQKKIKEIEKIPDFSCKGKGIPIGNMTSQAFALIYLNDLDHFIKEKLHVKYYVRYMDDFVLFSTDKEFLKQCKSIIEKKLNEEYHLQLNPKTKISPMKNGLDFLGFRFILKNQKLLLKVRTSTKRRAKRKVKKLNQLYTKKEISRYTLQQVVASYQGHIKYGNTYYLQQKIFHHISNPTTEYIGKLICINRRGSTYYQK